MLSAWGRGVRYSAGVETAFGRAEDNATLGKWTCRSDSLALLPVDVFEKGEAEYRALLLRCSECTSVLESDSDILT